MINFDDKKIRELFLDIEKRGDVDCKLCAEVIINAAQQAVIEEIEKHAGEPSFDDSGDGRKYYYVETGWWQQLKKEVQDA